MSIINQNLRQAFEDNVFSRKRCVAPQNYPFAVRRISNRADVIYAVKEVYYHPNTLWAHARGGKGKHALTANAPFKSQVDALLESIGQRYFEYFNAEPNMDNNRINFDKFHSDLCEMFMNGLNPIRSRAGYSDISYGQAQKLINLTFKYLSCYADYLSFADLFTHCHMVIDNIVLNCLSKSSLTVLFGVSPVRKISHLSGGGFNGKGWTEFSKEDYLQLVKEYREVIDPMLMDLTYMEVEYNMWPAPSLITRSGLKPKSISKFHF